MRVKDPRALGALVRTASEDKDWWVRERAVECMAEIGDARVVPHIVKLAEEDKSLLFVAIQALGKLKHGDGLRLLCRAVRHEDAEYRLEALASLAMVNDASADPYVRPLLEDTDARVRLEATQLLSSWEGRAVSGGGADVVERLTGLERLLWRMTQKSGDDLFIISGRPPHMKTMNQVLPLSDRALTPEQVEATLSAVMTPLQIRAIQEGRDVDFSMEVKSQGLRFRVNVFQQLTGWTGVFRRIVNEIHNFDELGLPPLVKTLADLPHGLVLIGGPTGSGKSTTLAAMIDHLNRFYGRHIITIEDPIEVAHGNKRSIVTQREVGSHTTHFGAALRSTLREDPDVILVGEMRDLDTIGFAVSAAETGHLVLGTVHTVSADTAVDRLIDAFPPRQHQQVRAMISQTLRAVVCQQLLRRRDGRGRVPAVEILLNTDAVANIIRRGQCFQLPSVVATSREMGMQSMDLELMRLCRAGLVDAEEAYVKSVSKKEFEAFLSELRAAEQAAAVGGTRRAAN
jgi:twitching motility protein PilT